MGALIIAANNDPALADSAIQVTSWQQGLPLDTIMLSISELRPKVLDIQARRGRSDIGPVLDFLRVVTLGHILPETPPLTPRRFQVCNALSNRFGHC